MPSEKKDLYQIFGVTEDATEEELKTIYKDLSLKYHPDKYQGSDEAEKEQRIEKFKELEAAKKILLNLQERKKYDLGLLTEKEVIIINEKTGEKVEEVKNLNPTFASKKDEVVDGRFVTKYIAFIQEGLAELTAKGLTPEVVRKTREARFKDAETLINLLSSTTWQDNLQSQVRVKSKGEFIDEYENKKFR